MFTMLLNKSNPACKTGIYFKITHQLEKDAQEACLQQGVKMAEGQGNQKPNVYLFPILQC